MERGRRKGREGGMKEGRIEFLFGGILLFVVVYYKRGVFFGDSDFFKSWVFIGFEKRVYSVRMIVFGGISFKVLI